MFVNYAHRGASHYAPENTLSAFYLGLRQGANGIETDIRYSKDGQLILFHDATLDRVTNETGNVRDYRLNELSEMLILGDKSKNFIPDRITTPSEFLHLFGHLNITFALEFKDYGVERETLRVVNKYGVKDKCIFTSFSFDSIQNMRSIDPDVRIGWLTDRCDDNAIKDLLSINGNQLCLKASSITPDVIRKCLSKGLSIRAWGIKDEEVMKNVVDSGIDGGMTVNFPDKLTQYLKQK